MVDLGAMQKEFESAKRTHAKVFARRESLRKQYDDACVRERGAKGYVDGARDALVNATKDMTNK